MRAAAAHSGHFLPMALLVLLSTAPTQADEIDLRVVDQAGTKGVASRIMMAKQDAETEVDLTDDKGEVTLDHTCMPGQQLFAEPFDPTYHPSARETCGESVLLRVKKRESPGDEIVDRSRSVILVESGDGTSKEYIAEYDGVLTAREVNLSGMTGSFCYIKLTFTLNREVYLVEEDGAWRKDDSKSSSETLAKDRTKTSVSGSCSKPPDSISKKVVDLGKGKLRSKLDKDLQGLLSRLQKMKGVESAELQ